MTTGWLRRHRTVIALVAGIPALILVALGVTGYAMIRHFDDNISQVNVTALLGRQPADLHPKAENILVIGSNTGPEAGTGLDANQSGTLIMLHIAADKKSARVMSIPPNSTVPVPSCKMGNGAMSAPTRTTINKAFAIGSLHGGTTALAAACTVKTVEQDTGIYVDHFIVINFTGFKNMVTALGGVQVNLPAAFDFPAYGIDLPAGSHLLNPNQALGYVRVLSDAGGGEAGVATRIVRQQAFVAALMSRARGEWYKPLDIYRFLDAVTRSLTIDSQLGGITGLYHLEQSVHSIPAGKVSYFSVPSTPLDNRNVQWAQPAASRLFASLRNDTAASAA